MTQLPLFQPPSEWTPPERFPDLSDAKEIAIDLETHDPNIKETGPGWAVGNGYIAGVAIAVEGWKGYFLYVTRVVATLMNVYSRSTYNGSWTYRVIRYFITRHTM